MGFIEDWRLRNQRLRLVGLEQGRRSLSAIPVNIENIGEIVSFSTVRNPHSENGGNHSERIALVRLGGNTITTRLVGYNGTDPEIGSRVEKVTQEENTKYKGRTFRLLVPEIVD
ncbi:OB-fold domain-containing protein [Candidatus Woesebacteria bacterium]|nr:OB-fold domain-containing protein [Candidatus Woesebacteria bacterium]